jgi:hypothetical protein
MDELMTLHEHGLFLRREALALGYDDRDLYRGLRHGVLERVRHGAYVPAAIWRDADPTQRHRLRGQAVLLTHDNRVALSHTSGALALGLRLLDPDLRRVHLTRLDDIPGRREHDVAYHEGHWTSDDIWSLGEGLVLSPEQCALGAALLTGVEAAVCVLDSVLGLDLATVETLFASYTAMWQWPGASRLAVPVRLARVGAESIGESRTRYLFFRHHLPAPLLQYKVYDNGRLIGITDFAWPEHGLLGEFDGKVKYGRLLGPGQQPGDAVFKEKQREDALREVTGFGMIRYTYGDLYVPERTAQRTRLMLRRGRRA